MGHLSHNPNSFNFSVPVGDRVAPILAEYAARDLKAKID